MLECVIAEVKNRRCMFKPRAFSRFCQMRVVLNDFSECYFPFKNFNGKVHTDVGIYAFGHDKLKLY